MRVRLSGGWWSALSVVLLVCLAGALLGAQTAAQTYPPPATQPPTQPAPTPAPQPATPAPSAPAKVLAPAIYRTQYIRADRLIETLKAVYPPEQLRVVLGPDEYASPRLEQRASTAYSSTPPPPPQPPPPAYGAIREVILVGEADVVAGALALCKEMDRPRKQVRFSVKFTNFDYDWLRKFGVQWSWAKLLVGEQPPAGATPPDRLGVFSFGKLMRNPLFVEAALTAGEDHNTSALKAIPSITVIDGEHGYILIGTRHLYPKLTGYTQAQTPIYDKEEVHVGISLDLGVRVSDSDDILLTLYPQVSAIIGYLEANGSSYPQISTLEQQTTIRVRDGETIVIGGLLSEKTVDQVHGIPGLMKVPYLGKLFTYQNKEVHKNDLVVLITAEIIKEEK